MTKLYITAPDGRVVVCPRGNEHVAVIDGAAVTSVNEASLKPGWREWQKPAPAPAELPVIEPAVESKPAKHSQKGG